MKKYYLKKKSDNYVYNTETQRFNTIYVERKTRACYVITQKKKEYLTPENTYISKLNY